MITHENEHRVGVLKTPLDYEREFRDLVAKYNQLVKKFNQMVDAVNSVVP